MSQLLEEILSRNNMTLAYKKVKANKGATKIFASSFMVAMDGSISPLSYFWIVRSVLFRCWPSTVWLIPAAFRASLILVPIFEGVVFMFFSPPESIVTHCCENCNDAMRMYFSHTIAARCQVYAADRQRQAIKIRQTLTDSKNKFKMKSASD